MVTREDPLAGVHAKIERANKHIEELHVAVKSFWDSEPHSTEWVDSQTQPGDKDLVYRMSVPVPAEI